jgi:hypothetical protein
MNSVTVRSFIDELEKLGAVSAEEARRSLDRLDSLEQNKPTAGQVARYGALGAAAGGLTKTISNAIESGGRPTGRGALAGATAGALSLGAVPLIRQHLDRKAEYGKLKRFMHEGDFGKNPSAATDAQTPTGLSR